MYIMPIHLKLPILHAEVMLAYSINVLAKRSYFKEPVAALHCPSVHLM